MKSCINISFSVFIPIFCFVKRKTEKHSIIGLLNYNNSKKSYCNFRAGYAKRPPFGMVVSQTLFACGSTVSILYRKCSKNK